MDVNPACGGASVALRGEVGALALVALIDGVHEWGRKRLAGRRGRSIVCRCGVSVGGVSLSCDELGDARS